MRITLGLAPLLVPLLVSAQEAPPPCSFGPGALPAETLPAGSPHGPAIPIDTIVVVMQENRSFDHYMGRLHLRGKRRSEAEPKDASNPDPTNPGARIAAFHQTRYCEVADLDHSWNGTHREWDGGAMDGFTAANVVPADPTGSRAMGFYDRTDLPFYYALYRKFASADRYFSSALTQTFSNRFYLLAGTSFGHIRNELPVPPRYSFQEDFAPPNGTIFELLDAAGVSWKIYHDDAAAFAFIFFAYVRNERAQNTVPIDHYFADAKAGTLPQVVFIDPNWSANIRENDEHPPSNIQVGQEFVARVIKALFASPHWPRSVLFLTYDEHGGFFDHVPPPPACPPDDIPPLLSPGDEPGSFDRYGIRVPAVVVSPFARRRFVSHDTYDHTSILRFIETRFDLPALTARDANADPMLALFSFRRPRFRRPPMLPATTINAAHAQQCESQPGGFPSFLDPEN